MIPAIPGVESVFWIMIPSKLAHINIILPVCPFLTLSGSKPVNSRPDFGGPILRILPESLKPLIPPLKQDLPQCHLTLKIPGFAEKPLTTHLGKVLNQLL